MKYLPILLISSIMLCGFGCSNGKFDKAMANSTPSSDNLSTRNQEIKPSNPFRYNDGLLFYHIQDTVYHQLKCAYPYHQRWGKIFTKEYSNVPNLLNYNEYLQIDSMAKILYSPTNFIHESDADWEQNEIGLLEYLNWELWEILKPYIGEQRVVNLMTKQKIIIDSLIDAQQNWFCAHFDATQESVGSGYLLKYCHIEKEMLSIQNANMKDILQTITDSSYKCHNEHNIPDWLIDKGQKYILNSTIPYYENDSIYKADADIKLFLIENKLWTKLMRNRKEIRNILRKDAVDAFDKGTFRLKFNRLRQLKNEFEEYDLMSSNIRSLLVSDSCSYDDLMTYPNFSTKWNEYLKQQ